MTYSSISIANLLISLAEEKSVKLTNMQVQCLTYLSHGWYLALTEHPLILEAIRAWSFGQVIPELYNKLKYYENVRVFELIKDGSDMPPVVQDEYVISVVRRVLEVYGKFDDLRLFYICRTDDSPWAESWEKEKFSIIPNTLIRNYFSNLRPKK
jgi:uncharacterized phage-associated protein